MEPPGWRPNSPRPGSGLVPDASPAEAFFTMKPALIFLFPLEIGFHAIWGVAKIDTVDRIKSAPQTTPFSGSAEASPMARSGRLELTWQSHINAKGGRWCKVIGGKRHYFGAATAKSDTHAYRKALT